MTFANTEDTPDADIQSGGFAELGLGTSVLEALAGMGFSAPTDVQARVIPHALAGIDLVVRSQTGSGKTTAFGAPLCDKLLSPTLKAPQGLVLVPTRELAAQVATECARISGTSGIDVVCVYGGAAMGPQVDALKRGTQLVVGTPGRILDHLRRGTFSADQLRVLVLDECDEMLSMGFLPEINSIIEELPTTRQTLLFSATIPADLARLSARYLRDPVQIDVSGDNAAAKEIAHYYYLVSGANRIGDLKHLLDFEEPAMALIFCNTREETGRVAQQLADMSLDVEGISGDLGQRDRERVMRRMRRGDLRYLVATDIAARGIDLADVTHVINYTFPDSADRYIHRTGRTGRAGKAGTAISLVSPAEIGHFYYLKLIHKITVTERHLPTEDEIESRREAEAYERVREAHQSGKPSAFARRLARRIWSTLDGEKLLASVLEEAGFAGQTRKVSPPPIEAPLPAIEKTVEKKVASTSNGHRRNRHYHEAPVHDVSDHVDQRIEESPALAEPRDHSVGHPETFTTQDGEVEHYETIELPSSGSKRSARKRLADNEQPGMVKLYLNVGRKHRVRPEDLASFVQVEANLQASELGRVQMSDRFAYVPVAEHAADRVVETLNDKMFAERPLRIERARQH